MWKLNSQRYAKYVSQKSIIRGKGQKDRNSQKINTGWQRCLYICKFLGARLTWLLDTVGVIYVKFYVT